MCVLGGIYLEKAVTQPLTDYVWLGGDPFDQSRLLFAARLFHTLKSAISTLRSYYHDLAPRLLDPDPQNLISEAFPFVTEYGSQKFKYLSRLAPEFQDKLLYEAKLDNGCRVVVKFVSTYHAEAHRIVAEAGLAPTLHYAGTEHAEASLYGGRYMIVMDFIEGQVAAGYLTPHQFSQVSQAIELLHSHNLVFGDLRPPNILITGEEAMIIDFDWCGREGEARYPTGLNCEDLCWPEGVTPDSLMEKQHDRDMLRRLKQ